MGPSLAECSRPSSSAILSGSRTALIQSSGATSGSPFSFREVNVGMVSPGTSSTLQPYPSSRMILSTFAISWAEAQFISAIWTSPHSAIATFAPSSIARPRDAFFGNRFMCISPGSCLPCRPGCGERRVRSGAGFAVGRSDSVRPPPFAVRGPESSTGREKRSTKGRGPQDRDRLVAGMKGGPRGGRAGSSHAASGGAGRVSKKNSDDAGIKMHIRRFMRCGSGRDGSP